MSIRTDLALAYQMGYDDALGRHRPEPRKAEDMADGIAAENSKLRELTSELYQCSRQYGCDRCGYRDGCKMLDRMRELGVEVDE